MYGQYLACFQAIPCANASNKVELGSKATRLSLLPHVPWTDVWFMSQ